MKALNGQSLPLCGERRYQPRRVWRRLHALLAEQPIVVRMGTDPESYETVARLDRQGTVAGPHASRPEAPNLLEV